MKKNRLKRMLPLFLTALLLLTSCGGAGKSSSYDSGYNTSAAAAAGDYAAEEAAEEYAYDGAAAEAAYGDTVDVEDSDMALTAYDDEGTAAGAADPAAPDSKSDPADDPGASGDSAKKNLEKIVYTCSADLQTLEYDESVKALKEAVKSSGGIIQSETESNNNYSWYYDSAEKASDNRNLYLTVRIPTEKYEEFVNSLNQYGQVMNKTQSADNISRTYNDKKTYIASLETEQKRLLEMMDKAETIEDMMAVEERLTEVQRQLNQYKTELDAMDMDVAYSTVTLNVKEVQKITNQPTARDSFWTRIKKAFINAWGGFASFCEDFLFVLIYLLPAILVIGAIVFIVMRVTRKKRRARKEKKRAEKEMIEDLKRRAQEERARNGLSGSFTADYSAAEKDKKPAQEGRRQEQRDIQQEQKPAQEDKQPDHTNKEPESAETEEKNE